MSKADILTMYCKTSCHNRAKDCPIVNQVGNNFCPKCGTVIKLRDENGKPTKWEYGDGLIPVCREDRHYTKSYACDCDVGRLRIDQHIRPYIFHGDEPCFLERTFQHLIMKRERNNLAERPSYSNIGEVALRILEEMKEQEQTGDDDTPFG